MKIRTQELPILETGSERWWHRRVRQHRSKRCHKKHYASILTSTGDAYLIMGILYTIMEMLYLTMVIL